VSHCEPLTVGIRADFSSAFPALNAFNALTSGDSVIPSSSTPVAVPGPDRTIRLAISY
jgi:hypothetical protein